MKSFPTVVGGHAILSFLAVGLLSAPLLSGCGEPEEVDVVHILVPRDSDDGRVNPDENPLPDEQTPPVDGFDSSGWMFEELKTGDEPIQPFEPPSSNGSTADDTQTGDDVENDDADDDDVVDDEPSEDPDDIVVNHEAPVLEGAGAYINSENSAVGIAVQGRDTDAVSLSYALVFPQGDGSEPAEMMMSENETIIGLDSVHFDSEGSFGGSVAFTVPESIDLDTVTAIRVTVIDHTNLRSNTIEQPIVNAPRLGRGARCDELEVLNQCHVDGDRCYQSAVDMEATCQP